MLGGQSERDIMEQSSGQYPVMDRSTSYSMGALQKAWDAPYASAGQTAPGVIRFGWQPDFVMALRVREYMVSTVNLPDWEQITNIIIGDPIVFEAKRIKSNIFAIRPSHAGADSNITVVGSSGRIYSFYVRSEGWNSDQVTDITVFVDSPRPPQAMANAQSNTPATPGIEAMVGGADKGAVPPDYVREIAFKPENLQFNMKIFAPTPDDVEIAPERVYNDGIWTYFDFGAKSDSMAVLSCTALSMALTRWSTRAQQVRPEMYWSPKPSVILLCATAIASSVFSARAILARTKA
jgi:type IV secretory pathway VirB9-like protein